MGTEPWPLIEAGRSLLLLDGLDEVPEAYFESIRLQISEILERAGSSLVLVTSRIAATEYVFPQLTEVEVADFGPTEIDEFVNLWFAARQLEEKAAPFLSHLRSNASLVELATSPLLLTMMCLLFEERSDFDGNRAELYEEAVAVLLRKWDARRSVVRDRPYELLTIGRLKELLSYIARAGFERSEYLFEKRNLEEQVCAYFGQYGDVSDLEPEAIIKAIEAQHGLLVERAHSVYSFSHLTFQEYFTARSIVAGTGDRWLHLLEHVTDPRWIEVFLLVTSMVEPDEILRRMLQVLSDSLCINAPIQALIKWLDAKSIYFSSKISPGISRCLHLNVFRLFYEGSQGKDRHGYGVLEPAVANVVMGLEVALNLDPDMEKQCGGDIDLDLSLARSYYLASEESRAWNPRYRETSLHLAHALSTAHALSRERAFLEGLQTLWEALERRPDIRLWLNSLRELAGLHRDIGNTFGFTRAQMAELDQAYSGYRLVVNCMNSSRVTKTTRAVVEKRILASF